MNKFTIACLVLLCILSFSACEKDDICVDGDTPLLVIRFYDATDLTEFKDVSSLVVRGLNSPDTLDVISNVASDSITLPLRSDALSTSFILSQQSTTDDPTNIDVLTFFHETKKVYVSRACGFVANYENLSTDLTIDTDNWIKNIEIASSTVDNTEAAHVKIFH